MDASQTNNSAVIVRANTTVQEHRHPHNGEVPAPLGVHGYLVGSDLGLDASQTHYFADHVRANATGQ